MSEPDMQLPEGMTCLDCRNFQRCAALVGVKGHEVTCDWSPSRFQLDALGALGRLLESADATLTLYGEPVTVDQLRNFTETIARAKLAAALEPKP